MNVPSRSVLAVAVLAALCCVHVGADHTLLAEARARLHESPSAETAEAAAKAVQEHTLGQLQAGLNQFKRAIADGVLAHHKTEDASLLDLYSDYKNRPNSMRSYSREKTWETTKMKIDSNQAPGGLQDQVTSNRDIQDRVESTGFNVESTFSTYQLSETNGAATAGFPGRSSWELKRYDLNKQWEVAPVYNACEDSSGGCTPGFFSDGIVNGTTEDSCSPTTLYRKEDSAVIFSGENAAAGQIPIEPAALTGTSTTACGRNLRVYRLSIECDTAAINELYRKIVDELIKSLASLSDIAPTEDDGSVSFTLNVVALRATVFQMKMAMRLAVDTDDFVLAANDFRSSFAMNTYMSMSVTTPDVSQSITTNMNVFTTSYSQGLLRSLRIGDPGAAAFDVLDTCAGSTVNAPPAAPSAQWYSEKGHVYPTDAIPTTTPAATGAVVNPLEGLGDLISPEVFFNLCRVKAASGDADFLGPITGSCPVTRAAQASAAMFTTGTVDGTAAATMEASSAVDAQAPAEFETLPPPPGDESGSVRPVAALSVVAAGLAAYATL